MVSKNTKNVIYIRITALIVILTLLLSVVVGTPFLSLAVEGEYGTEADGVSGNVLNVTPSESFNNGDFSDGFKYWGSYFNNHTGASEQASIVIDGENKYMEIDRDMPNGGSVKGVRSVPFKIKNLSAGDEIYLFIDYKVSMYDSNTSGQKPLIAAVKSKSSGTVLASNIEVSSPAKTNVTKWTAAYSSAKLTATADGGEDTFYVQIYINYGPACKLSIDNVNVAVKRKSGDNITPEGYYELTDGSILTQYQLAPNMYGTIDDGLTGNVSSLKPINALPNGDFNQGLRYWGSFTNTSAGAAAKVKQDGENYYAEFIRETDEYLSEMRGLKSVPISIKNMAVGDEIALYVDYKVDLYNGDKTGQQPFIAALRPLENSATFKSNIEIASPRKLSVEKITTATSSAEITSVSSGGEVIVQVSAYLNYGVAGKAYVDNIVVVVRHNSGENITPEGYYELLDGTLVTQADLNPNMYGTVEDGFSGNVSEVPAVDTFKNGDFAQGFRYWGSFNKKMASAEASIKKDSENSYLEILREKEEDLNSGKGINSVPFEIKDLAVGDEIFLFFDYKIDLYNGDQTGQQPLIMAVKPNGDKTKFKAALNWGSSRKTSVNKVTTASASAIIESIPENGIGVFEVCSYLNWNVAGKAYVDNIVIAVRRNSGANKTPEGYYELLDGTLVTQADLNPNMYGTVEDGFSGNVSEVPAVDTFKNGDFAQGFRYWGSFNKKMASAEATIKKDSENSYLEILRKKEEDLNSGKGINSVPFEIKDLAVGDEIFLFFDYKIDLYNGDQTGQQPLIMSLKPNGDKTAFKAALNWGSSRKTSVNKVTRASASAIIESIPENGIGVFEVCSYLNWNVAGKAYVDNIVIAVRRNSGANKTPDGYYELLDGTRVTELQLNPDLYGTEDGGISGTVTEMTALDTFKNGNFSEGLKYWGSIGKNGVASNQATIAKEGSNKYLVVERKTPENSAQGVASVPFKISGLKEGDVIAYKFDFKTETYSNNIATRKFYVNLNCINNTDYAFKGGSAVLGLNDGSNLLKNATVKTPDGWSTMAAMQIIEKLPENSDPIFYISLYLQYKASGKMSFDNFEVYVRRNSGANKTPDGYYETLDGKLVSADLFKGVFVTSGSKDIASGANDTNYPGLVYSWIGTETEGIYSEINSLCNNFPTRTNFMNGDFSKGLQYWFESKMTGYTYEKVDLLTEKNGNRYIEIAKNGETTQINQTGFWLPDAQPGDQLYVMAKFRKNGNPRIQAYISNIVEGAYAITRINNPAKVIYEPESKDDWGICVSQEYITVGAPEQVNPDSIENTGGKFRYYVMFNTSAETQLDDIMFVKKSLTGGYVDLKGNKIDIPVNTNNLHYDASDGFDWKNTALVKGFGALANIVSDTDTNNADTINNGTGRVIIIWIIAAGFIILAAGGIITFLAIKKKKVK